MRGPKTPLQTPQAVHAPPTPSCVPLPSTFVVVEFEFHLYVNVRVTQNSTTVDFSEDFYNELDALSEQMKQEVLTQGLDDPIVILKIKYSLFDTSQYHKILYSIERLAPHVTFACLDLIIISIVWIRCR